MKSIRNFLIVTVLLTNLACKDDHDSPAQDPIIGTWQPAIALGNGVFFEFSDCQKQGSVTFEANGSYSSSTYLETSSGDNTWECMLLNNRSGTWERISQNQYAIAIIQATPGAPVEIFLVHADTLRFQADENNYADYIRL